MSRPALKNYQVLHKKEIVNNFGHGLKRLLVVMPTGSGKTTVFSSLTQDWQQQRLRVLIIVHRIELVDQIFMRLKDFGVDASLIIGGQSIDVSNDIQVATIQSLPTDLAWAPHYIVIDECHHSTADTYKWLWTVYPESKILGMTATPIRLDGKTFGEQYQMMLDIYPIRWYVSNGHLLAAKHYVCSSTVEKLKVVNGEYDLVEGSKLMRSERKMADVIKSYQLFVPNRQAIVFASGIDHSMDLTKRFNECGIPAAHVDGSLEKNYRNTIIEYFRRGALKVLVNYDIFSEGLDVPGIEATIFARKSKSLRFFIQGCGRCVRPDPLTGKRYGYVLDCSNLWMEHGIAGSNYQWSLTESVEQTHLFESRLFWRNKRGTVRSLIRPQEDEGIELCQLTDEMNRLFMFDRYLAEADRNNMSATEAVRMYDDFLKFQGFQMSVFERRYCENELKRKGHTVASAFWREPLTA